MRTSVVCCDVELDVLITPDGAVLFDYGVPTGVGPADRGLVRLLKARFALCKDGAHKPPRSWRYEDLELPPQHAKSVARGRGGDGGGGGGAGELFLGGGHTPVTQLGSDTRAILTRHATVSRRALGAARRCGERNEPLVRPRRRALVRHGVPPRRRARRGR